MSVRPAYRPVPATYADFDVLTDVLSGFNVRRLDYRDPQNFIDEEAWEAELSRRYPWDNFEPLRCWRVAIYNDGCDVDEDGNRYFDDYPSWDAFEYHTTQRGAELAAMWLIGHHGFHPNDVMVEFGWQDEIDYDKQVIVD